MSEPSKVPSGAVACDCVTTLKHPGGYRGPLARCRKCAGTGWFFPPAKS
jgi:hypothetical protein